MVNALTGLWRGIVRMRRPFDMTVCLPSRTILNPAFSRARTACRCGTPGIFGTTPILPLHERRHPGSALPRRRDTPGWQSGCSRAPRTWRIIAARLTTLQGRRLARDGGGGEVALGIARDVRIGAVLVDPEQTAPAKVPLHAPDGALEHGADLARLQVPEPLPAQLVALLVPGAIESDQVQVGVEPEIRRSPPQTSQR